ncbi:MAG: hypothetical protein ACI9OJ_001298, partial [Myxococcota bacterium]
DLLEHLHAQDGASVPVDSLADAVSADESSALPGRLIQMYALGLVDLYPSERPRLPVPERPRANAMVRRDLLLGSDGAATLSHRQVSLSRFHVQIVEACDGRSSHDEIAEAIAEAVMDDLLELTLDGSVISDRQIALEVARRMVPDEIDRLTQLGIFE